MRRCDFFNRGWQDVSNLGRLLWINNDVAFNAVYLPESSLDSPLVVE
jgi:hypothetical protein